MTGRHALVIGGSSDIGAAVAAELVALGNTVTVWGRDAERLRAAAGDRLVADVVDLADHAALPEAVGRVPDTDPPAAAAHTGLVRQALQRCRGAVGWWSRDVGGPRPAAPGP